MFRTDQPTAASSLPTPAAAGTPGYFTNGNPGTGTPGTVVDQDFLNMVQEELCNVVTSAGGTLSKTNHSQVYAALLSIASSAANITGSYKNLVGSWSSTTTATWTADAVILKNSSGGPAVVPALNVSINTANTVGSLGGLDSGSLAASTWYYVHAVSNGTAPGAIISLSRTAPGLPSGYTEFAPISCIYLDGSKNIRGFLQNGDQFQHKVGSNLANAPILISGQQGNTNTPTWVAASVSNFVPPTAYSIKVFLYGVFGGPEAMVAPNSNYGAFNSTTNPPPIMIANSSGSSQGNSISAEFILESSNVYYAVFPSAGSGAANAGLACLGWRGF